MTTFGYTGDGSSWTGSIPSLSANKYYLSERAKPLSISLRARFVAGVKIKYAIYDTSPITAEPDTLLAYTEEWTQTTMEGWKTLNIVWRKQTWLPPGYYWLTFLNSPNFDHRINPTGGISRERTYDYGDFPDPYGTPDFYLGDQVCIYCTYDLPPEIKVSEGSEFTALMNAFRRGFKGNPSFDVTHSALLLGDRDTTTGWYSKNYSESTIQMIIIQKESQSMALKMGYYVNLDALGLTIDTVKVYDLITDIFNRTWEVESVKPIIVGDTVKYFKCDLKEMPLYE